MNRQPAYIIATLLIFPFGAVAAQGAASVAAEAQPQPAQASAQQAPAASAVAEKASTPDKAAEPISGAFGITLGERFQPSMVAKVLGKEQQSYKGKDSQERKGSLLRIEPSNPDEHFQSYALKTSDDGVIYAIQGNYQFEVEAAKGKQAGKVKKSRVIRKRCKDAVKNIASELESKYGKPRGRGWDGEWFTWRQFSDTSIKSLRLYAHRCRTGAYSILYSEEYARQKK